MSGDADLSVGPPGTPKVDTPSATPPGAAAKRAPRTRFGLTGDRRSPEPGVAPDPAGIPVLVGEGQVRMLLRSTSGMFGALIGDDDVEGHWRFTTDELDELVPPLTRYVNRTPRLALAVMHGDELVMAEVLAGYVGRNLTAGRTAKEARREREREVEGTGPVGMGTAARDGTLDGNAGEGVLGGHQPGVGATP